MSQTDRFLSSYVNEVDKKQVMKPLLIVNPLK